MPLIEEYELTLRCPPCEPGSERWSAFATLRVDIAESLPYLNAVWADACYDHSANALVRRTGGHAIAIRPREVAVSAVLDRCHAERLVRELIAEINEVWARRGEIVPRTDKRQRPSAMELYRLLPRTNCKACGQPTCWSFALQLTAGNADLALCAPLAEPGSAQQRAQLQRLLGRA